MKFSPSVSSSRRKSRKVGVKAVKECFSNAGMCWIGCHIADMLH